ncbi:hypothetical protein [Vibrio sp. 99-70-13A1]|uniref:hypothetical protein n=1 Tax=Vibrio sp. 99-70-13A1 TaxID=2607601 RepID=UPI0014936593|nr:hypothetical protein [Vibrio sp. 99-70-13A1]NOH96044.1 hypothetical protein [Vibrio sp. 99-70-13A1]
MGLSDPAGFYFFTLDAAPAEDIYNLTPAEIKKYQFNNVATAKVTDPRATYSATYTELQSVLFDVKSDTKHGLNAENNVRTIAYIIDESVSSVFKAFNVSTIKELEALLKTHGNSFVKANYKATIEADGALKVVTVNKANIGFSGPRIIEHEKGIAEFKKPAKETEMIILLKDHVVDVDLFGKKFSHSKSDSNQEFVLCAIPETSDQGENEVHTRFCSKTAISAANVNTANEVTISTKNKKTGKVEVQVMKLENYNFELNRKQSTLVQQ